MNHDRHQQEKKRIKLDITSERLALLGSVGVNLVLALFLLLNGVKIHTILVPPEISKTMWVEVDQASDEYLQDMSFFIGQLVLNTTPLGVEYQGKLLRKYACSDGYGALDTIIRNNAARLKHDSASTLFSSQLVKIDRKSMRVAMQGLQSTFIGDRRVADESKTYLIGFDQSGGKLCVKEFYEASEKDPLGPKPADDKPAAAGPGT